MGVVSRRRGQLWFSSNLVVESTEKKRMDTHPEIPNCYPPSGETAEYDTISNSNVSPFLYFWGPYPPLWGPSCFTWDFPMDLNNMGDEAIQSLKPNAPCLPWVFVDSFLCRSWSPLSHLVLIQPVMLTLWSMEWPLLSTVHNSYSTGLVPFA